MRAFIALELPVELKRLMEDIQRQLYRRDADIKWVNSSQMHLTLKFLGDISDEQASRIGNSLHDQLDNYSSFPLTVYRAGTFPPKREPKVIWLGIKQEKVLPEIFEKVEKITTSNGISAEKRRFSPHLTMGRVKNIQRESTLVQDIGEIEFEPLTVKINNLSLFKSKLTPKGPLYSVIESIDWNR